MLAVPGGQYQVRLRLSGPVGADPAWLVSAIRATWGGMDVVNMRRASRNQVVATVRASRRAALDVGDAVRPITQGIRVPGLPEPSAEVEQVEPVLIPATRAAQISSPTLSDEGDPGWRPVDAIKIGLSMLLISATVGLSMRIKGGSA